MTSSQKWILFDLILVNVVLFGGLGAAVLLLTPQSSGPGALQSPLGAFQNLDDPPAAVAASSTMPSLDPGWKSYTSTVDHFAISLPAAWKQIPADPAQVAADLDLAAQQNPELDPPGSRSSSIAPLIKFIGVDTAPGSSVGDYTANVNVIHRSEPIEAPLDVYVPISLKALQDLPAASKPIFHRRVLTYAGEAEEFSYQNIVRIANQPDVPTTDRQYVLVIGKEFFVVNCSAPLALEDRYLPVFEKIAASFRWIDYSSPSE